MKIIAKFWNRLWFQEYDPLPTALFRISMGTLIIVWFLVLIPNWENYYGAEGYLSLEKLSDGSWNDGIWSLFHWTEGTLPVFTYWILGFLSSIGFTVGFFTRTSTLVLYLVISSMIHRHGFIVNGEDLVFRMTLFYSLFAPLGHKLSVDEWIGHRNGVRLSPPRIWAIRCMQINIAFIYIFSLPAKLFREPAWLDGTAMYWVMMADPWARWPGMPLFFNKFVQGFTTYSSFLVETAFALLFWFPPVSVYLTIAIATFHFFIIFILQNIVFFTLSMVASFWVFLRADEIRRFIPMLSKVFRKFRQNRHYS